MILRYFIPLLAIIGLISAIVFTQVHGKAEDAAPNQLSAPPETPYENTVSGLGIVEANSRNIEVGSFLSGIVENVYVKEGDKVNEKDPLFALDSRQAKAEVDILEKEVQSALAQISVAKAELADRRDQLNRSSKLKVGTTVSEGRLQQQKFAVDSAKAAVTQAEANYKSMQARLDQAQITLDQHTVHAPISARILKTNINPGEYITATQMTSPAMLLGADNPLHLRVNIDENDVWRFTKDAPATASLRSNKDISFDLEFVRVEPYVQPKVNLNGDMTERVDTRVLQVIYSFNPENKPVYIGQQMDVFIQGEGQ